MQISSISTTQLISVGNSLASGQASSYQGGNGGGAVHSDGAVLNFSADSFSSLVNEASSMPEVRSDVVDLFKARIASGHYPSQDIVAGLTHLMGGAIADQLKAPAKI